MLCEKCNGHNFGMKTESGAHKVVCLRCGEFTVFEEGPNCKTMMYSCSNFFYEMNKRKGE